MLLWTFKPQNKRKPYLCLHFLSKKAPRIARILRLSCRYCFPVHQWSIALIYEWLVDFSHLWHYNKKLSKYKTKARWHEGKSVGVIKTTERLISLRNVRNLWFAFLHIRPFKIISINVVTSWTKYILSVLVYFTVVNSPLESQFHIACVDTLLSTVNSVFVDSAMSANDVTVTNF